MSAPDVPRSSASPSPRAMRVFKLTAGLVSVGLLGLVVWAVWMGTRPTTAPPPPPFERFRPAWSSAMARAGVEATFPDAPVELAELTPGGRRAFEATFTAEEITALLNVYRHKDRISGSDVVVDSVAVSFPSAGHVRLSGAIVSGGSRYYIAAEGTASYNAGRIESVGLSKFEAEGFDIGGARKRQAERALVQYFNAFLDAAPGLTIERAAILDGALAVEGFAPVSLANPLAQ